MTIVSRQQQLQVWLTSLFGNDFTLTILAEDASFRRYFRMRVNGQSYVIMDAPPEHEDCRPFLQIATVLLQYQVHAPRVYQHDLEQGFLILSDLGDDLYLSQLNDHNADTLYHLAIDSLLRIQQHNGLTTCQLRPFDSGFIMMELQRFNEWFLQRYLGIAWNPQQQKIITQVYQLLCENAKTQPQVMIHRDYHSRNLMVTADHTPGVLDFQDAMLGPVTYDLVSLLRDCYIVWPAVRVAEWRDYYFTQAQAAGIIEPVITVQQFTTWFDLMGIQRHLKAIGNFARLNLRDGKPKYLQDIPRTLHYVLSISQHYPALAEFQNLLQQHVVASVLG